MTYLADACALIVFYGGGPSAKEMKQGRAIMESPGDVVILPTTVWEIMWKVASGKLEMPDVPSLGRMFRDDGFQMTRMTWEDAEEAAKLPQYHNHKDPMDRFLIASALRTNMSVITCDGSFEPYGVRTVW